MKIISRLIFLILLLTFVSCDKDDEILSDSANKLIGSWVYVESDDSYFVYERVHSLVDGKDGFTFKTSNKMINRAPTSWCGTPPVGYADYKGVWSEKDSIIHISVEYWGGKTSYEWKMISVDDEYLKVSPIMQVFEE